MVGVGFVMLMVTPLETAVVGVVFRTVIVLVPPEATSDAGIVAFNRVLLTYSVDLLDPPHRTMELRLKLLPFTVSMKPLLPAETLSGEIDVMEGGKPGLTGLSVGGEEDPPPQPGKKRTIRARTAKIRIRSDRSPVVGRFSGLLRIFM